MFEINCLDFFVNCLVFKIIVWFFEIACSSFFLCFFSHGGVQARGPNPEKVVARRVGAKGLGPEGWAAQVCGPEGWGAKFRVFFPSPAPIFILFFPLCGSSRGILVVFEAPGRSNVHIWSSLVVRVEPWRPQSRRRGFTRQPENSKRAKLRVLALQTPPKFHETPR